MTDADNSNRNAGEPTAPAAVKPWSSDGARPRAVATSRRSAIAQTVHGVRAITPYANYAAQRLGKVGIIGIALLVFSVATLLSTNAPLREQLLSGSPGLEQVAALPGGDASAATPVGTPQTQFVSFLDQLPNRDDLPDLMGKIVATSVATGVELEEGQYELMTASTAGEIARYRLSYPVVGSYPQVRAFIDRALVAVPAMSLDGLSLERGEVSEGVVTADIDFAVFVRTGF